MSEDVRRLGMCCECGNIFDLATGMIAKTPAVIVSERLPDDKTKCLPCSWERDKWPSR